MKEQAVTTSLENRQRVRSRVSADPSPSTKAARRHRRQLRFEPRFLMAVGNNATASEPDHRLRGLLQDFGGDEVFKAERSIKLKPSHSFNERPLRPPLRRTTTTGFEDQRYERHQHFDYSRRPRLVDNNTPRRITNRT